MKQISILGCGWLGLPLAQQLVAQGCKIYGATTSEEKLSLLEHSGIKPFLIQVSGEETQGDMISFLEGSEVLLINIPPKLRSGNDNFVAKVQHIIAAVEASSVRKVLFVSSTSVYPDQNQTVTDDTIPQPDSESGRQLFEAEQLLKNNPNFQTTILRFGGLIGKDRHPIVHLAGRKALENPQAPINLIHLEDCIAIIRKIIETDSWNETYNAVAPFHPTRKAYYTKKATDLNLEIPQFNSEKPSLGKTILSNKIISVLQYTFAQKEL